MRARNINEAWQMVNEIFRTDYMKDDQASANTGYPVYWSTLKGNNAWISDLGCRLEVNQDGRSINIWIDEDMKEAQEIRTEKTLSINFETEKRTGDETTKTVISGRVTFGKDTDISEIIDFQKTAEKAVKAAVKACMAGQWFTLTIYEGQYKWTGDRLETTGFNSWEAVPVSEQSADGDGVYLRPDTRYTAEHRDAILRPGHVFQNMAEYIG